MMRRRANPVSCPTCGKTFIKNFRLLRHQSVHLSSEEKEKFICDLCNKSFGRKDTLVVHIRNFHAEGLLDVFECDMCGIKYKSKFSLISHNSKKHGFLGSEPKVYQCHDCSFKFMTKTGLKYHIQRFHLSLEQGRLLRQHRLVEQKCLNCDASFKNKAELKTHYKQYHGIQMQFEEFSFESYEEFERWKSPCYRRSGGWTTSTEMVYKYGCHRTGYYKDGSKDVTKRERHLKITGSKKLQGFCPGEMIVRTRRSDGFCFVTLQKVHVGHDINDVKELQHVYLSKTEKLEIARKLIEGVPKETILNNIYLANKGNIDNQTRFAAVNSKDISNIATTLKTTDPIHLDEFVMEHKDSILFFKNQGEKDTVFDVFDENDFILVYQDDFQSECLKKFGYKTIAFDTTHGLNAYDFKMHTMLVIDILNQGIPVAYLLSNRSDQFVIDLFIRCVKNSVGTVNARTIMSDMDAVYHNSWGSIMNPPTFTFYCTWNVRKAWELNLQKLITVSGLTSQSINESFKSLTQERQQIINFMKQKLHDLASELDEHLFLEKLTSLLSITDPILMPFIDYFRQYYADNTRCWAFCYRIHAGVNVNMHIESFHRVLKYTIGKRMEIETISAGLQCIVNCNTYRKTKYILNSIRPKVTTKLRLLRQRHLASEQCHEEQLIVDYNSEYQFWHVGSFKSTDDNIIEMYSIIKVEIKDCSVLEEPCPLACNSCKSCFHEYQCSCPDSAVSNNMCKHIHALASYLKNKTDEDTTSYLIEKTDEDAAILIPESIETQIVSIDIPSTELISTHYIDEPSEELISVDMNEFESDEETLDEMVEDAFHKVKNQFMGQVTAENKADFEALCQQYLSPLFSIFQAMQKNHTTIDEKFSF